VTEEIARNNDSETQDNENLASTNQNDISDVGELKGPNEMTTITESNDLIKQDQLTQLTTLQHHSEQDILMFDNHSTPNICLIE
jgi:hypothetical protein